MTPYLVMGLGNPGQPYHNSRHNAGFCVLDAFAQQFQAEEKKETTKYILLKYRFKNALIYMVKPLTFMNLSGTVLNELRKKTGVTTENLIVICDNMDLPLGRLKIKVGGGSAGQKGLQNIIDQSGTANFARLYVGIGRPTPPQTVPDYVLGRFNAEQEPAFLQTCAKAAEFLASLPEKPLSLIQADVNRL